MSQQVVEARPVARIILLMVFAALAAIVIVVSI